LGCARALALFSLCVQKNFGQAEVEVRPKLDEAKTYAQHNPIRFRSLFLSPEGFFCCCGKDLQKAKGSGSGLRTGRKRVERLRAEDRQKASGAAWG
jgi:hypothetical protein